MLNPPQKTQAPYIVPGAELFALSHFDIKSSQEISSIRFEYLFLESFMLVALPGAAALTRLPTLEECTLQNHEYRNRTGHDCS